MFDTLQAAAAGLARDAIGVLPRGGGLGSAAANRVFEGPQKGPDGKMCYASARRVPGALGLAVLQESNRTLAGVRSFHVSLTDPKVIKALRDAGLSDSLDGAVQLLRQRMDYAIREGQEHRDTRQDHEVFLAALVQAFGLLRARTAGTCFDGKKEQIHLMLLGAVDELEQLRWDTKASWAAEGGQIVPAAFASMCAYVWANVAMMKTGGSAAGGADDTMTTVFNVLKAARVLDGKSPTDTAHWKRDRDVLRPGEMGKFVKEVVSEMKEKGFFAKKAKHGDA